MSIEVDNIKIGNKKAVAGTVELPFLKGKDGADGRNGIDGRDGVDGRNGVDGKDYMITSEDYRNIANQVESDIQPILNEIRTTSQNAETIAKGRATGYVFDTFEEMESWLQNTENTSKLVLGDNLYIRAVGVPDYWWDGNTKQVLETQKVDLSEYVTQSELNEKLGDIETALGGI